MHFSGGRMINFEPIPLYEACTFLSNRVLGFHWNDYAESLSLRTKGALPKLVELLIELEGRLESSIAVSDEVISILFAPLSPNQSNDMSSNNTVSHILIPDPHSAFSIRSYEAFFDSIMEGVSAFPRTIMQSISPDCPDDCTEIDAAALLKLLKSTDISADSKLLLMDVALDGKSYVQLLEQALTPIAKEFERSTELIKPLLDEYKRVLSVTPPAELISKYLREWDNPVDELYFSPSVYASKYIHFGYSSDSKSIWVMFGVLFALIKENGSGTGEQNIVKKMDALGNQKRFDIVTRLLDGPAYGRELSKLLGVSPVTVSQHVGILAAVNLVTVHNDGARIYYSLNTGEMEAFINAQRKYFIGKI